jgi:hypothetical protein
MLMVQLDNLSLALGKLIKLDPPMVLDLELNQLDQRVKQLLVMLLIELRNQPWLLLALLLIHGHH